MTSTMIIDTCMKTRTQISDLAKIEVDIKTAVMLLVLTVIAFYRREMSCNRVYLDSDDEDNELQTRKQLQPSYAPLCSTSKSLQIAPKKTLKTSKDKTIFELPPDININIMSFLHPKDVVSLSCSSRHLDKSINSDQNQSDVSSLSSLIWLTLWNRDFAWVIMEWDVGIDAVRRSCDCGLNCPQIVKELIINLLITEDKQQSSDTCEQYNRKDKLMFILNESHKTEHISPINMKDFYFRFSQTWVNYTIAGHATQLSCLVGLHGHIFDITDYLDIHPGSYETLLMQGGGRDATSFFECVGHSLSARGIAMKRLVRIVDLSCCHGGELGQQWGLISSIESKNKENNPLSGLLPISRSRPRRPGSLHKVKKIIDKEIKTFQLLAERKVARQKSLWKDSEIVGSVNVYYDPLCGKWMGWYLDLEFSAKFVVDL